MLNDSFVSAGEEWSDRAEGWRIIQIRKGNFYWMRSGEIRDLNQGDVVVLGPAQHGVLRASRIADARLQYFYFQPEHLIGLLSLSERNALDALGATDYLSIIPAANAVAAEFWAMANQRSANRSFLDRCHILKLIGMIFTDALGSQPSASSQVITSQARFDQVIQRVPESELMNLSCEKLAEMCGCSPRHFRRMFRTHFKTSLRTKQTELRLENARQLLQDTRQKIGTIAVESGYRHLGLFNAMFKRRFGMTPSEWRRQRANGNPALNEAHGAP